jgi:hypothetical protein
MYGGDGWVKSEVAGGWGEGGGGERRKRSGSCASAYNSAIE